MIVECNITMQIMLINWLWLCTNNWFEYQISLKELKMDSRKKQGPRVGFVS